MRAALERSHEGASRRNAAGQRVGQMGVGRELSGAAGGRVRKRSEGCRGAAAGRPGAAGGRLGDGRGAAGGWSGSG